MGGVLAGGRDYFPVSLTALHRSVQRARKARRAVLFNQFLTTSNNRCSGTAEQIFAMGTAGIVVR